MEDKVSAMHGGCTYNKGIGDAICERLASGESLRKAAVAVGVAARTVLDWTENAELPEFAAQYARAREIGYQLLADEIIEIADDSASDATQDDDGNVRINAEVVARSRLRVDSRKWMLSKMLPKLYGDKLEVTGAMKHEHAVGLQPATARFLGELRGESGDPGAAAPVPD